MGVGGGNGCAPIEGGACLQDRDAAVGAVGELGELDGVLRVNAPRIFILMTTPLG